LLAGCGEYKQEWTKHATFDLLKKQLIEWTYLPQSEAPLPTHDFSYPSQKPLQCLGVNFLFSASDWLTDSMTQENAGLKQKLQRMAPYILVVAVALLIYETYLLQKSFLALYQIYLNITQNTGPGGVSAQGYMWFFSESSGEVGLILRFIGSLFFVAFAAALWRKKTALKYLTWGVLLEAIQYLFLIPFITQWVVFSGMAAQLTIISFGMQILLITPTMLVLYLRLKRAQTSLTPALKAAAVAAVAFMFAMWIKHFLFNLYALPVDFSSPVLTVGFVNSAVTILVSALILAAVLYPFIRGKTVGFSFRGAGAALIIASVYFIVYLAVAAFNGGYQSFLLLTELWMVSLLVAGIGFLTQKK
jgi:hypothetical protein